MTKENIIELLFVDFRVRFFLDSFEDKGISIDYERGLDYAVWDVVLDIIGFPKDNTIEYFKKDREIDEKYFSRDWLQDNLFKRLEEINNDQDIFFDNNLLKTKTKYNPETVKKVLYEYVDWLLLEYENLDN